MFTILLHSLVHDKGYRCTSKSGSERVLSAGTSVPVESGCTLVLARGHVHQTGSSPNALLFRIFMDASLCRHDQLVIQNSVPLPMGLKVPSF